MSGKIFQKVSALFPPYEGTLIEKAQLRLFYLMLGANVLKGTVYLADAVMAHQGEGSMRALRLIITSLLLIAILRRFPKIARWGIHYAVLATILHIYYRVFNRDIGADPIALQAIFMVVISAFYGLNKRWGAVYTVVAALSLILSHYISFRWTGLHPLPQGLNDVYIVINFLVILIAHVYFHGVLFNTIHEKDALNEELARVADEKTSFLSTMSHELRTPLNAVIGIAGLLTRNNQDPAQKEHLDILKFSAEGLVRLINDVLDVNKMESGKLELESVPFNLYQLLKSVSGSMVQGAEEKSIQFAADIDRKLEGRQFIGDPTRLSQIIYNLVGNAIKFTNFGAVTLRANLLRQLDDQYIIRFEIEDTGIGITKRQQEKIFDPYVQASETTTRNFGGTGLGLTIVKQLVLMFGSEIHINSKPGFGTTFYFDIVFKEHLTPMSDNTGKDPEEGQDLSKLRILLAEDHAMNIFFMRQLFKQWHIQADIVENGMEVINLLKEKNYDLLLLDLHMPVMDGWETVKNIREMNDPEKAEIYIIALTGSVSADIQERIVDAGMNDYLSKPFQMDDLKLKLLGRLAK
ncbi:sensory box histidine kinase/response regulator [Pedobacter sp. BAL39]|uniref:ATP-binding protein n=1 Tax=Pedobacter sp. BAL39 TaxID=391596 RepID=UPI0001559259|nr:ATP-binding protein [Pedobacter sp. BAL39]EDM34956.1 sensory box histidine kinase/response regulator [Pedobacter sp. BAL39]